MVNIANPIALLQSLEDPEYLASIAPIYEGGGKKTRYIVAPEVAAAYLSADNPRPMPRGIDFAMGGGGRYGVMRVNPDYVPPGGQDNLQNILGYYQDTEDYYAPAYVFDDPEERSFYSKQAPPNEAVYRDLATEAGFNEFRDYGFDPAVDARDRIRDTTPGAHYDWTDYVRAQELQEIATPKVFAPVSRPAPDVYPRAATRRVIPWSI